MSVRGPSHEKSGGPNEDAMGGVAVGRRSLDTRLVAVSDGHGERAYFRSERGAAFAVQAGLTSSREFLVGSPSLDLETVRSWAQKGQPVDVVRRWRELVGEDYSAEPFTVEELGGPDGADARLRGVAADPVRAYGATLLGAAVTEDLIIYYQLGDGDIVTVSVEGVVGHPLGDEAQAFSNVTSSLCDQDPLAKWRGAVLEQSRHQTAFILLASDGYSGAFEDKESFLSTVGALAGVWRDGGPEKLRPTLEQSVAKARTFTGDDATVAILYRVWEAAA
jgi:hypothetical protein